MAQTRRKRQTKHRGNAAGVIESRGRTGRKPTAAEKSGDPREAARAKERQRARQDKVPTWRGAFLRAMAAAVLLLVVMLVFKLGKPSQVIALFPIVLLLYVPISYYTDQWIYKRRKRNESAEREALAMSSPDVRAFTVGAVQENCYIVRADSAATRAVIVDPGDEPERLLGAARDLGVQIEAILLTHTHFDHIGAVAPVARESGAPVYCPQIERPVLADVMRWTPPGFGPFESYEADHTLAGGEHLSLAGIDFDVVFTPGHSPGHLTYAMPGALLSGDVLFQGSVGRVDLPGGDWATLERSIEGLLVRYPAETIVYPGHMGVTTLGRERDTNPFLSELRARLPAAAPANAPAAGR